MTIAVKKIQYAYLKTIALSYTQLLENFKDAATKELIEEVDLLFAKLTMKIIACFLSGIIFDEKQNISSIETPLETDCYSYFKQSISKFEF